MPKMYKDDQVVDVHPSQIQNMQNRGYTTTPPTPHKPRNAKQASAATALTEKED